MDGSNYGCVISVDFQKAFVTVDHDILLKHLEHYDIKGISNNCFASCLSNRKQFVSINGFSLDLAGTGCKVPQGSSSMLNSLLFLVCISDFHCAINIGKHITLMTLT